MEDRAPSPRCGARLAWLSRCAANRRNSCAGGGERTRVRHTANTGSAVGHGTAGQGTFIAGGAVLTSHTYPSQAQCESTVTRGGGGGGDSVSVWEREGGVAKRKSQKQPRLEHARTSRPSSAMSLLRAGPEWAATSAEMTLRAAGMGRRGSGARGTTTRPRQKQSTHTNIGKRGNNAAPHNATGKGNPQAKPPSHKARHLQASA